MMYLIFSTIFYFMVFSHVQGHEAIKQPRLTGFATPDDKNVAFFASDLPNTVRCSGAFIHYDWIITAASCVYGKVSSELRFKFGVIGAKPPIDDHFDDGEYIYSMKIHPSYNDKTRVNDIVLIKTFDRIRVQSYKITRTNPNMVNSIITFRGYGEKNALPVGGTVDLKKTHSVLTAVSNCLKFDPTIQTNKLCSTNPNGQICWGDQGGPLVLYSNNELIGIISVSNEVRFFCSTTIMPIATYTNIFLYRTWIAQITGVDI